MSETNTFPLTVVTCLFEQERARTSELVKYPLGYFSKHTMGVLSCGDSALARRLHSLSRTCNKWTASVYVTLRVIRKGVYEVVQRVLVLFLKVRSIGTNE